jgi:hypothetical protein
MTKLKIQIDDLVRNMTKEEEDAYQAKQAQYETEANAKTQAKSALLDKLGLSAEEVALLLS